MRVVARQLDTPKQGAELEQLARMHHAEVGGAREFHEDGVLAYCKAYGPQRVRSSLNCWIAYNHYTEVEKERQPVGYLLAKIAVPYGTLRKYAYMEMLYTVPESRNILTLMALMQKFDEWAQAHNCERQHLCVEYDDDRAEALRQLRLYESLGYKLRGYITAKYVNSNTDAQSGGKDEVA